MSNAEQALRLLRELERLDQEADDGELSAAGAAVTAAELLEALVENNFNLTAAILDVRNGA
jgi:NACalpha-BTF3-like transcription factor